jgi:peptidoglycan/xylan/chitin deacetylase (PgdA/CDA1 family)
VRTLISKFIPGRLKYYVKRVHQQVSPRAVILMYHRVIDLPADPQLLCVSPRRFAEHMQVLARIGGTMSLSHLAADLGRGQLGKSRIAVTFDDGYCDNLRYAKPLMQRYGIPGTVFVTSGYVASQQAFWWDELQNLLLRPGPLPHRLDLRPHGVSVEWRARNWPDYGAAEFSQFESWNITSPPPTERHELYIALHRAIRPLAQARRDEVMRFLYGWAHYTPAPPAANAPMTAAELQRLVDGNLIEVGAHTATHPVLSQIPVKDQEGELGTSRKALESIVNRPVTSFAYPYGGIADYTPDTVEAVRRTGFLCACSNFPALVRQNADTFQLPRYIVRDWSGEVFEQRLREWMLEW